VRARPGLYMKEEGGGRWPMGQWGSPDRCCVPVSQRPSNIRKSSFGEDGRSVGRPWYLLPNGFNRKVSISVQPGSSSNGVCSLHCTSTAGRRKPSTCLQVKYSPVESRSRG
jgi:hypothetical protein